MTRPGHLLLATFLVVAACSPSETTAVDDCATLPGQPDAAADGPDAASCTGTGAPTERATGGYVRLERFVGSEDSRATALAEIYSGQTGPGRLPTGYYGDFPEDTCFQVPLAPDEPTFYDFVDVGPAIELSGPAAISMPRETVFDNIYYRAAALEGTLVPDASYQVTASGVTGTLRMPREPVILEPPGFASGQITLTGPLAVTWEPVGADRLYLVFQQDAIGRVCRVRDDGAFTVPAESADLTPSWGTMAFVAIDRDVVDAGGLAVELVGMHGRAAAYERQP